VTGRSTGTPPSRTWAEMTAMLETALLKVVDNAPASAPKANGIPYRLTISGAARQLAKMRPRGGSHPHNEATTAKSTKAELEQVAKRAEALLSVVEALHKPAIDALGFREPWPTGSVGMETQLRILAAMARNATVADPPPGTGLGAKVKAQPQAIARLAACHYLGLAGRMPTVAVRNNQAYGPFIEMLASIFDALAVNASVENQAREAIAFMEKNPLEQWPISPLERPRKT